MFSTENYIQARRGNHGTSRFVYLQRLVTEYQDSQKLENRQQIIANLANFAYDPYNYAIMKELNIVDLFLDGLSEEDEPIREYAVGGICNSVCDSEFVQHIVSDRDNIRNLIRLLSTTNENILLSTLTTLFFLVPHPETKQFIQKPSVRKAIHAYATCENVKISNVASCLMKYL